MAFIYSASGKKISLELSGDDIGVKFADPAASTAAALAVGETAPAAIRGGLESARGARASVPRAAAAEMAARIRPARSFGRLMLLRSPGAAKAAFSTVKAALPAETVERVQRTLPVFRHPESGLRLVATREIEVRIKRTASAKQIGALLKKLGLHVVRRNRFNKYQCIVQNDEVNEYVTLEIANQLFEADEVEFATPNFLAEYRKHAMPLDDPRLEKQWHLQNRGDADGAVAGADVKAFEAWEQIGGGAEKVVIAVIDDGVDLKHPDLKDSLWVNPKASAPDPHGRNFFDDNDDPSPVYFKAPYDDTETNDIHGTACAGVAAARGDNGIGVAGAAYRSRILAVKIFGGDGLAPTDAIGEAIQYAGLHADILSCSWAVPENAAIEAAISDVVKNGRKGRGCLVFCATGNENARSIGFPASHPDAMAVGASNDRDKRASYSNYGEGLDFVTPSGDSSKGCQDITTTDVSIHGRGYAPDSLYTDGFDGTSSATPLAAGVAALVLAANPKLTWREARGILRSTADKIDKTGGEYVSGVSRKYGYGRLNALKAVKKAAGVKTAAKGKVKAGAKVKKTGKAAKKK